MECMTIAFLGTRLSFTPEYAPPEETEKPPKVSTRCRQRHFIPTDDARLGEGDTSQCRGRHRADQSLINEVNPIFGFSGPSTATPVEPYYPTFDIGELSSIPHDYSQYQTARFVIPHVATLDFVQCSGSQS
ncbi:hypothetical protein HAX54_034926 [Datura stramonium]|uniref:Uncharacterized protein n=1 Tax=Datura stramonium TaxID=4076 RepID=A0ABS8VG44_DATST|nr:hypothetical protein [Datura stramonium]